MQAPVSISVSGSYALGIGHGLGCDGRQGLRVFVRTSERDAGRGARDKRVETDCNDPVRVWPAQQGAT